MQIKPGQKPPVFDMEELSCVLALAKLRMRHVLLIQPIRDALTGLYTRQYMNVSLRRQIRRAARAQRPLALIVFDFDNFQHFNCMHGPSAGDSVLRELGKFLRRRLQPGETASRFAGGEFVILLPDTSLDAAVLLAQQLKEEFAKVSIPHGGENLRPMDFSLGVSVYPESGSDAESLLHVAEEAMYAVKKRERVQLLYDLRNKSA